MSKQRKVKLMIHPLHSSKEVKKHGGWAGYYQFLVEKRMARIDKQGNIKIIIRHF